jgi:hypothetical protein
VTRVLINIRLPQCLLVLLFFSFRFFRRNACTMIRSVNMFFVVVSVFLGSYHLGHERRETPQDLASPPRELAVPKPAKTAKDVQRKVVGRYGDEIADQQHGCAECK